MLQLLEPLQLLCDLAIVGIAESLLVLLDEVLAVLDLLVELLLVRGAPQF